jgi:hypothetical protein
MACIQKILGSNPEIPSLMTFLWVSSVASSKYWDIAFD